MDTTSADTVKAAMLSGYEGMLSRRSDEAEVSNRRPMLLYEGGPGHPLCLCMGHWLSGKRGYEVCWNWVAWNLRHRYVDGCDGSSELSFPTMMRRLVRSSMKPEVVVFQQSAIGRRSPGTGPRNQARLARASPPSCQ